MEPDSLLNVESEVVPILPTSETFLVITEKGKRVAQKIAKILEILESE